MLGLRLDLELDLESLFLFSGLGHSDLVLVLYILALEGS